MEERTNSVLRRELQLVGDLVNLFNNGEWANASGTGHSDVLC